jgi:hypothetical protein
VAVTGPSEYIVEPSVVVGVVLDLRIAEAALHRPGITETAEYQQPVHAVLLSTAKLAQRGDRVRHQRRRKRLRSFAGALRESGELMLRVLEPDGAWSGIDDQLLALLGIGDVGVAQLVAGAVAMLAGGLLELIPARLLVREVDSPMDVVDPDLAALPGMSVDDVEFVADLQLAPIGTGIVVDEHAEPSGLPSDPAVAVLELADRLLPAVLHDGVAIGVAIDRQRAGGLRRNVERVRAVPEPRDPDGGMDTECRCHGGSPCGSRSVSP